MSPADGEPLEIVEFDTSLDEAEKPAELPNGTYDGEIQEVSQAIGAGKGNAYYSMQIKIGQDSIPANMQDAFDDGVLLTYNRQLVPIPGKPTYKRSLYNLRKLMEALDQDVTGMTTFDPSSLMGLPCKVRVKQSAYQGEMRANITDFVSVATGAVAAPRSKVAAEPEETEEEEAPAPARKSAAKGRR